MWLHKVEGKNVQEGRADLKEISITGRTAFRIWHVRSELGRDTGAIARRRWLLLARPCSSGRAVRMLSATLLGLSVQHTARSLLFPRKPVRGPGGSPFGFTLT